MRTIQFGEGKIILDSGRDADGYYLNLHSVVGEPLEVGTSVRGRIPADLLVRMRFKGAKDLDVLRKMVTHMHDDAIQKNNWRLVGDGE